MEQLVKNKKPELKEFDSYIKNYRENLNLYYTPTGESFDYFTTLKAHKLKEWLLRHNISNPSNILDFGCGDGAMTAEVKKILPSAKCFGVDPSLKSIDIAQKTFTDISFLSSNETIPFEDNYFDVVYAAGVFHHISFDLHENYINECIRVLKPKGLFIIFELNPLNPGTRYIFNKNPIDQNATMLTPWYAKKITKLFYKETVFYCFFPKFLNFLRPIEKWISKIPLGGLYGIISQKNS